MSKFGKKAYLAICSEGMWSRVPMCSNCPVA